MGDIFSPIQVQIEKIEDEVERLYRMVRRMVRQHAKISRFLMLQERVLTRRVRDQQSGEEL
ncbi:ECU08_1445 [Encephalitozoon cuniculi GB-M1]|uniref:ECU08_1445 protein n=1 Tax=Encephalitozoon cuniculi (strain GB-M1) TaxID=284813 RepID=A0A1T5PD75_ENCCU|nr:uncharacterized protein ECU08_1445 [Encephalitozoon cuniculi GB-M1]SKD10701.1 ECU08_1445 [Encephalitozoon cuniculi GB-M1]